jgi:transcriptional regulator with PAS, ATPase and Fis domain
MNRAQNPNHVSDDQIKRATRMYRTSQLAATALGISTTTLLRRRKKLGIEASGTDK